MFSKRIVSPSSIAIIGASEDPASPGNSALCNIMASGYTGKLYVVNSKEAEVQGFTTYPTVLEIPNCDLAIIADDGGDCVGIIATLCEKKECAGVILFSNQITGSNAAGKAMEISEAEKRVAELVDKYGITIIGPNSSGIHTPSFSTLYTNTLRCSSEGIDIISSSRTTISFMIDAASHYGLKIANVYSVGNSIFTTVEDIIEWIDSNHKDSGHQKVIAIYIERISDTYSLLSHCRSLVRKGAKIVAIKGGCSTDKTTLGVSHTGVMLSPDIAVSALFAKCGIIRAYGREEMMNIAAILYRSGTGKYRLALLTQAGGSAVILIDLLNRNGVSVNDIFFEDYSAGKKTGQISKLIDKYDKDSAVDSMAIIFGSNFTSDTTEVSNVLFRKITETLKPIYPIFPSQRGFEKLIEKFHTGGGITFNDEVGFGRAFCAIANAPSVIDDTSSPAVDKKIIRSIIKKAPNGWLPPFMVQQLLDASGIYRIKQILVKSADEAVDAAISIGYPVALKVTGPLHRVEVGGLALDITDEHTLRSEFNRMSNIEGVRGFVVQPMMMKDYTEIFIGAKREESFGATIIMCGLGGIFVEALKDISFSIAPVSVGEAERMIHSLKGYPVIKGYRERNGVNEAMLNETIRRVSALCVSVPEIVEMDLNPLFGNDSGVTAIGARIRIEKNDR